ncbi:uncharacterized protein G2W53_037316 [Senna tora]|uniref:Uncharacterized protein n=1 Tax=Senna tora TaxID=362788 RepID=A0A834W6W9_9FABA|nr:uncharacterized protein G2W53_037316 [Senna tora]
MVPTSVLKTGPDRPVQLFGLRTDLRSNTVNAIEQSYEFNRFEPDTNRLNQTVCLKPLTQIVEAKRINNSDE